MGKKREEKNIIKNQDRPYRFWTKTKKIFAGIIVAVIIAGAAIGLAVGLGNTNNPTPPPSGPSIEQPDNPSGGDIVTPPGGGEIEKPDPGPVDPENPGGDIKPDPGPEEPEIPPVDPGGEDKPAEITNSEIISVLNNKYVQGIYDKCLPGLTVTEDKVSNQTWYLIKDAEGNITGAEFSFNFERNNLSHYYNLGRVDFSNKITAKDLIDGNTGDATYSYEYQVNYKPSIQAEKQDLTEAICDELFQQAEGEEVLERYIVVEGFKVDQEFGTAWQCKVVEISNNQVKEVGVRIKDPQCSADELNKKLIENFNAGNYAKLKEQNIEFSGNKLEKSEQSKKLTLADVVLEMPDGNCFELV